MPKIANVLLALFLLLIAVIFIRGGDALSVITGVVGGLAGLALLFGK